MKGHPPPEPPPPEPEPEPECPEDGVGEGVVGLKKGDRIVALHVAFARAKFVTVFSRWVKGRRKGWSQAF
jgi:hypothetical protein